MADAEAFTARRVPMFPLGAPLVPGQVMPLHIFEPRYRALMDDVVAGDRRFGICLIDRGSEVGGGEVRRDVGTMAHIVQAEQHDDGRWAIAVIGEERIDVVKWLPDDPYPVAEVVGRPDPAPTEAELVLLPDVTAMVLEALERVAADAGKRLPDLRLADDPVAATYQLVGLAPLGPHDRYQLLATPTVGMRLALLHELLADGASRA